MKTKGLIYILATLFVLSWSACEENNPMPKFTGDYASFLEPSYTINIIPDFNYLEIPVYHKNPSKKGSLLGIDIITSASNNIYSIDKTTINFDESDTAIIKLSIDYNQLSDCETYSIKLKFSDSDNYLKVA